MLFNRDYCFFLQPENNVQSSFHCVLLFIVYVEQVA